MRSNVLDEDLQACSERPRTGFRRDGREDLVAYAFSETAA